jgi:outer membrane biosynthesis protein TonB
MTRTRGLSLPVGLPAAIFWGSVFISAAVLSAAVGFVFGQRALEGIRSPVTEATSTDSTQAFQDPRRIPLLNEDELISRAREGVQAAAASATPRPTPDPTPTPTPTPTATPTPTPSAIPTQSPELATVPSPPPNPVPTLAPVATPAPVTALNTTSGGRVNMQVLSVQQQGGQLVLGVAMQNSTSDVVRFLYSFMSAVDDRGRAVNVLTQGLPGELPPNSGVFQGTVSIPLSSLRGSRSISLNLSDYPSRQHQLSVSGIPVPN